MYSCRTQRPPLDVDDAVAAPITTPSSPSGIAPQLLLASHQLSMMTMASHHRRRHHADSSCGSFAPPSSHSGTAWPPSSFLRRRPPSRMKSVAPQPTRIDKALNTNCWRRLLAAPLLLLLPRWLPLTAHIYNNGGARNLVAGASHCRPFLLFLFSWLKETTRFTSLI